MTLAGMDWMAMTEAGGLRGAQRPPPFANNMICITLPY